MSSIEENTRLEPLSAADCERHLAEEAIGRIALVVDGVPEIFPVNYVVDGRDQIYFRTDEGTKLSAVVSSPTIAFEIDGFDEEQHSGWSVVAVGLARRVTTNSEVERIVALGLQSWAVGDKPYVVHLAPSKLTGRQIHPAP